MSLEVGPNGENIHVELMPDGLFYAHDQDNYDYDSPIGCGKTKEVAIQDLMEQIND